MSYSALVCRIKTRDLPGSDNIKLGTCSGYIVIVSKETENNQLGIFFEEGGQLSKEFLLAHDLVKRKDEFGNQTGGFFEEKGRVKAISMRGARSEGFWCPLSYLDFAINIDGKLSETQKLALKDLLVEGYEFDTFNGVPICNKYITPATFKKQSTNQKQNPPRKQNIMFKEHIDTAQFKRNLHTIPDGAHIIVNIKMQGTSQRYGHVIDEQQIKYGWIKSKLAKYGLLPVFKKEWKYIWGTRRTVQDYNKPVSETAYYGTDSFRKTVTRNIELHKGEVLYGEIVGYTEGGALIMPTHSTKDLKDKSISKQYGPTITYKYGCEPGTCKLFVYRITTVNEDGVVNELSWNQLKQRCFELGLQYPHVVDDFIYDGNSEALATRIDKLVNGSGAEALPDPLDSSHPIEGVVIRVESEFGTQWMKEKSWIFKFCEGIAKEDELYIDLEESS